MINYVYIYLLIGLVITGLLIWGMDLNISRNKRYLVAGELAAAGILLALSVLLFPLIPLLWLAAHLDSNWETVVYRIVKPKYNWGDVFKTSNKVHGVVSNAIQIVEVYEVNPCDYRYKVLLDSEDLDDVSERYIDEHCTIVPKGNLTEALFL